MLEHVYAFSKKFVNSNSNIKKNVFFKELYQSWVWEFAGQENHCFCSPPLKKCSSAVLSGTRETTASKTTDQAPNNKTQCGPTAVEFGQPGVWNVLNLNNFSWARRSQRPCSGWLSCPVLPLTLPAISESVGFIPVPPKRQALWGQINSSCLCYLLALKGTSNMISFRPRFMHEKTEPERPN